jgi:hypothetical protein
LGLRRVERYFLLRILFAGRQTVALRLYLWFHMVWRRSQSGGRSVEHGLRLDINLRLRLWLWLKLRLNLRLILMLRLTLRLNFRLVIHGGLVLILWISVIWEMSISILFRTDLIVDLINIVLKLLRLCKFIPWAYLDNSFYIFFWVSFYIFTRVIFLLNWFHTHLRIIAIVVGILIPTLGWPNRLWFFSIGAANDINLIVAGRWLLGSIRRLYGNI